MKHQPKKRILQYIEKQGISKRKFCEIISVSESYFTKDSAMGSDVLENISQKFDALSIEWVITGKGEMLKENATIGDSEAIAWKEKYFQAIEQLNNCLQEKDSLYKKSAGSDQAKRAG